MKKIVLLFVLHSFLMAALQAQVRFANIFSDNMVIQAHKPIKIWGNASAGEVVKVFLDK